MEIYLYENPFVSTAIYSISFHALSSCGRGFGLPVWFQHLEHPCAKGQHQHPVPRENQNKEPSWDQNGSLDGLGSLEHCSIHFWGAAGGEGGPPTGLPADEGPAQKEVAAHQYAGVVAARQ